MNIFIYEDDEDDVNNDDNDDGHHHHPSRVRSLSASSNRLFKDFQRRLGPFDL
jgi:hypothetical protein